MELAKKHPAFETSTETYALIARIERAEIGELISYEQLLDLTGLEDRRKLQPHIRTARRHCWRNQVYVRTEIGKGLMRVDPEGAVDRTARREDMAMRFRRQLRREWAAIIDVQNSDKLQLRTKMMIKHDMLNSIEQLYRKPKFMPKLTEKVALDPNKVIALFSRKRKA